MNKSSIINIMGRNVSVVLDKSIQALVNGVQPERLERPDPGLRRRFRRASGALGRQNS